MAIRLAHCFFSLVLPCPKPQGNVPSFLVRSVIFSLFILSLFWLFAGCSSEDITTNAKLFQGKVVAISDGDTFTLLTDENRQVKIRLYGIDCPEKKQPFGNVAKQKLSEWIFGRQVIVQNKGLDRWKRTIGMVVKDGININEKMLKAGLAWHYTRYDNNIAWSEMERNARSEKIGLWVDENPTPPWEWRHK